MKMQRNRSYCLAGRRAPVLSGMNPQQDSSLLRADAQSLAGRTMAFGVNEVPGEE